jgi:hypothetical protein
MRLAESNDRTDRERRAPLVKIITQTRQPTNRLYLRAVGKFKQLSTAASIDAVEIFFVRRNDFYVEDGNFSVQTAPLVRSNPRNDLGPFGCARTSNNNNDSARSITFPQFCEPPYGR